MAILLYNNEKHCCTENLIIYYHEENTKDKIIQNIKVEFLNE